LVPFPQVSPPKPSTRLSPPPSELHAPLITFFSILSLAQTFHFTSSKLTVLLANNMTKSAKFSDIFALKIALTDHKRTEEATNKQRKQLTTNTLHQTKNLRKEYIFVLE
jgi:hypothetical protein